MKLILCLPIMGFFLNELIHILMSCFFIKCQFCMVNVSRYNPYKQKLWDPQQFLRVLRRT